MSRARQRTAVIIITALSTLLGLLVGGIVLVTAVPFAFRRISVIAAAGTVAVCVLAGLALGVALTRPSRPNRPSPRPHLDRVRGT